MKTPKSSPPYSLFRLSTLKLGKTPVFRTLFNLLPTLFISEPYRYISVFGNYSKIILHVDFAKNAERHRDLTEQKTYKAEPVEG